MGDNMYTLTYLKYHENRGFMRYYLANDGKFYLATNDAMKFHSPDAASRYYNSEGHKFYTIATMGQIEGPRGGIYRVNNGQYWR